MNDLLDKQPENVTGYLQEWIKSNGFKFEGVTKSFEGQLPTSDEDEEMDSDEERKMEQTKNSEKRGTQKKMAVSAEAYGEYNKLGDYKPKVVTKTPE